MFFHELYSQYYKVVSKLIESALERPLDIHEVTRLVTQYGFGESLKDILPIYTEEKWSLILRDGTTRITNAPKRPLTTLEKSWLNAISNDPRFRLFDVDIPYFEEVPPLFNSQDIILYDQYIDSDPYTEEDYIRHFRIVLRAIQEHTPLKVVVENRKGGLFGMVIQPMYLEYSEKDDKFRVISKGRRFAKTINLARIHRAWEVPKTKHTSAFTGQLRETQSVCFELQDERKALERVLFHFAHLKKRVTQESENKYQIQLTYDTNDETEIMVRLLSFGPMVKVIAPETFVKNIKERLRNQKKL